jgi:transposase, IS30 family
MPPKMSVQRREEVLGCLVLGMNPCQAARAVGVSEGYARKLHRSVGGVYRPVGTTFSSRYLNDLERAEIARLLELGTTLGEIGRRLQRATSTISREIDRNSNPATGRYEPVRADRMAWDRQRRPKPSKLSCHPKLLRVVQERLDKRCSPEQVAGRLPLLFPDDESMRISPESIYQSLYVYPRGELKRELQACLRRGRNLRKRRGGPPDGRGRIVGAVPIGERPAEVEGRLVPGHHEGDLIKGSIASNSAVGTIVERQTGYLTLLPLPDGWRATQVADAVVEHMTALPAWFTKTLTWDRGIEMARHASITDRTGIKVYFADPHSPYQRGSNENTNGLLREYLPKGADLNAYSPADLLAIQDELNDRPRKRLGFYTPREILANLLQQDLERVATTT